MQSPESSHHAPHNSQAAKACVVRCVCDHGEEQTVELDPQTVLLDPESVSSSFVSISILSSASHHCDFGLESRGDEVEVGAVCDCVTVGDEVYAFLAFTPMNRSRGRSTFVSSNLRSYRNTEDSEQF
jgi:hypothetical protein